MMWWLVGYLACSILSYGIALYSVQQEFPTVREKSDVGYAIGVSLFGPVSLVISLCMARKYGLQFKSLPPEPVRLPNGQTLEEFLETYRHFDIDKR